MAPTLTSISPGRGYTTGGTSVTLTGTGFTGATGVTFGGTAATNVTVVNDTTITCTTPARMAGSSKVVVKHGDGDSTDNVFFEFFVRLAAPTLTAEQVGSLIVVRWAGGEEEPEPDDFDPNDGTWLWVTSYGAVGNGVADDTSAIQSCVTAAKSAGKGVYLPEGTYKLNSMVNLSSNVVIRGKSVTDSSLVTSSRAGSSAILNVANTDDVEISHLSLVGPGPYDSQIIGVGMTGATGVVLHDLQIDDLAFGIKVGAGDMCSDLHFYDIVSDNCRDAWFLASCEYSLFERMALAGQYNQPDGNDHTFYLEREVRDCVFNDCKLGGGQGWALHIYNEAAAESGTRNLTFNRLEIDVRDANYPLLISYNASYITFNDIIIRANNNTVYKCCVWFYGAENITFDGIEAGGCNTLAFAPYDWATYTGTVFKNGTFEGTYLLRGVGAPPANAVAGITFQNVDLISQAEPTDNIVIERKTTGAWTQVHSGPQDDEEWEDEGPFAGGTTYYYRGKNVSDDDDSEWSDTVQVTFAGEPTYNMHLHNLLMMGD